MDLVLKNFDVELQKVFTSKANKKSYSRIITFCLAYQSLICWTIVNASRNYLCVYDWPLFATQLQIWKRKLEGLQLHHIRFGCSILCHTMYTWIWCFVFCFCLFVQFMTKYHVNGLAFWFQTFSFGAPLNQMTNQIFHFLQVFVSRF